MPELVSEALENFGRLAMVTRALTRGLDQSEILDVVLRQGAAGLGATDGDITLFDDADTQPERRQIPGQDDTVPISTVDVALVAHGVAIGVLTLSFPAPRVLNEADRLFLHSLADLAALALAEARKLAATDVAPAALNPSAIDLLKRVLVHEFSTSITPPPCCPCQTSMPK